jgi:hypothetical protein
MFLHPLVIDLGEGVLKSTYNDARLVDVKQKTILLKVCEYILFQSYIERSII